MEKYGTVINCMDGRVQLPVLEYLKKNFDITYFDAANESAPLRILTERENKCRLLSLKEQIRVSLEEHGSTLVVLAGHHDCKENPVDRRTQEKQIDEALRYLMAAYGKGITYMGLYVNDRWEVEEYVKLEE